MQPPVCSPKSDLWTKFRVIQNAHSSTFTAVCRGVTVYLNLIHIIICGLTTQFLVATGLFLIDLIRSNSLT